jgi:type I restriction enzyme S subunit
LIRSLEVVVPPLPEQRAIAEVLGALDDKIEANRVLGNTARALGMAHFERAVNTQSDTRPVADLIESIARGIAPKYVNPGEGIRVLNQKCIRDGWVSLQPARWMQTKDVPAARMAYPGDVVVNSTGVGTLGRVARWLGGAPTHVDGHVTVVRPDRTRCHPAVFGYAMLRSQPDFEALGEGSTGQTELSRDRLATYSISVPVGPDVTVLGDSLDALDALSQRLADEAEILETVRDALLPQLLSGIIRIREIETLVGEAV